jgi:hypothetical protein
MAPFTAGKYDGTLAAGALGQTADGLRIQHEVSKQLIIGDNFGDGVQDAVYRGMNMFAGFTLLEFEAAKAQAAFWPYSTTWLDMGVIGRLDVATGSNQAAVAAALIFTALANTPAALDGTPASFTFPAAILRENFPVEILFGPVAREVPLSMRLYPNSSGVVGTVT